MLSLRASFRRYGSWGKRSQGTRPTPPSVSWFQGAGAEGLGLPILRKRWDMAVKETKTDLHPLCYEHHLEMKPLDVHPKSNISGLFYACPKPDCLIHYNGPVGYFVVGSMPRTRCPHHGLPMYLAEIQPRKRSFRLWRCPLLGCKASLTNEGHLAAAKYQRRPLRVNAPRTRGKGIIGA